MIACDEIISVMDIVSTKMTNTIATTNVTRNCHSKKVRHCYIFLYSFSSDHITIDNCYHYAKDRSKQKGIDVLTI